MAIGFLKCEETHDKCHPWGHREGGALPANRRKWRDLNENVTVLRNELSGKRTLDEYWLSIFSVCAERKLKFLI